MLVSVPAANLDLLDCRAPTKCQLISLGSYASVLSITAPDVCFAASRLICCARGDTDHLGLVYQLLDIVLAEMTVPRIVQRLNVAGGFELGDGYQPCLYCQSNLTSSSLCIKFLPVVSDMARTLPGISLSTPLMFSSSSALRSGVYSSDMDILVRPLDAALARGRAIDDCRTAMVTLAMLCEQRRIKL